MNPGKTDIPAQYLAPETAPPIRRGAGGAASLAFKIARPLWVGRERSQPLAREQAGAARTTAITTFLTRYQSDIAEGGRLIVEGRTFDILTVTPHPTQPRNTCVLLDCQHVQGISIANTPKDAFTS